MSAPQPGKVYLVGGGPGDPGLLTLKGLRCLQQADFVLYDGLVNPLLLRHTHAQAERTARADAAGQRILQQEQINQRLIDEARLGKTVVRLKGGDPYIFGRGSEEAAALTAAGIEFEVVPGITAATAAAEYAGFSLTHRDHASAVCLITGHEDPLKHESSLDYQLLAKFPGTLVFYMGLHRLPVIAQSLIEAGKSPHTPAAIITKASTPQQRVVSDTLAQLPEKAAQAGLKPPSLIVVGECVSLRDQHNWFEHKPLFGQQIVLTRPAHQAEPQIERLSDLGAQVHLLPLIDILPPADWQPIDQFIARLASSSSPAYSWIVFTSANGVTHLLDRLWQQGHDLRLLSQSRLACIGPATAEKLAEYHLRADLIPDNYCAEDLAAALIAEQPTAPVLWIKANRGRDVLPTELRHAGVVLEELVVYQHQDRQTLPETFLHACAKQQLNWITLSSPAMASQLGRLFDQHQLDKQQIPIAAISPITAAAATQAGFRVPCIATDYCWEGLLAALQSACSNS